MLSNYESFNIHVAKFIGSGRLPVALATEQSFGKVSLQSFTRNLYYDHNKTFIF